MKIEATLNNDSKISFEASPKDVLEAKFNNEDCKINIFDKGDDKVELSYKGKKHIARLLKYNLETKEVVLKLDGDIVSVKLENEYDLLLKSLGMDLAAAKKVNELKAPMPGIVLDIMVNVGDYVEEEGPLVVLEAMKMENVLGSPTSGTVKEITVEKGDTVEKNKILIHFE